MPALAAPVPALPPLDSTYGVWLVSLLLMAILYGMGLVQTWMYFMSVPTDSPLIQLNVLSVVIVETLQIVLFFRSSYYRFVERFYVLTIDLLWFDSVQLICAYLGAFLVQIFFAIRVFKLAKGSRSKTAMVAMYTIFALAIASIATGIAQTAWTAYIGSFAELEKTKAVTTVQAATSLACDFFITLFLCIFFTGQKGAIKTAWELTGAQSFGRTNYLLERLIFEAINRGILTALSSAANLVLFLAIPNTYWFFLGLAPSSKLYMNSMLATLNMRQYTRDHIAHKGWNTLSMGTQSSIRFQHSRGSKPSHHYRQGFDSKPTLDNVSVVDSSKDCPRYHATQVRLDREAQAQAI